MMITVRTRELRGKALDWAVIEANGESHREDAYRKYYSEQWEHCGELLEKYCIELSIYEDFYSATRASTSPRDDSDYPIGHGSNYREAICRFVVLYQLGEEVQIPASLQES
ncbi:phage protein NinX family protein [Providencia hangzhouensis]|uniref:phage protein NinX family protein n=1 Tax=Providencia TaxID=586 RepID=UPI00234BC29A|nr:phage protein NinX family protein [Providencia sp. PROV066]